jgi:V-type H+-transporting ATPase subunit E
MDSNAPQNQIKQMITFIQSEASDKACEIQKKGEEEFSIEVHRLITDGKEKLRKKFETDVKKRDTQLAINKSLAINKQRLEKIKARQDVMANIASDVKEQLVQDLKDDSRMRPFVTKLIVQGLLMLLETQVSVRCKESDSKMVQSCLADAAKEYSSVIKKESGVDRTVTVTIDKQQYLPDSGLGGVVLSCANDKITIDNTIDIRLKLVMEQDKPAIRKHLFGESDAAQKKTTKSSSPAIQNGGSPAPAPAATAAPAAAPTAAPAAAPASADYKVGRVVTAWYTDGSFNKATIKQIDNKKKQPFKVNWQGFEAKYDTWISTADIQQ